MYAIIRSGGKQYKVAEGERLRVASMEAEVDAPIDFDEVLAVGDDQDIEMGRPLVASAKVTGKILSHGRGRKIIVFTKKRRGGHKKKQGHRQDYTEVLIESISAGKKVKSEVKKTESAPAAGGQDEGDEKNGA